MVPLMLGNSPLKTRKGPQDPKLLATSLGHPRGDISFGYHGATNLVKSFSYGPEEGPCRELGTAWPSEFVKAFPENSKATKVCSKPCSDKICLHIQQYDKMSAMSHGNAAAAMLVIGCFTEYILRFHIYVLP